MASRVPVSGPSITQREIAYVTDAVTNAWYDNANCYHERFETAFAAYVRRDHAISLPSCTSGLHLALAGLGIGPGDEVIVPDLTWIASSAPIHYVGATPVFVDVDSRSWCLDPDAMAAAMTERTRAVIVVDLYGNMPDMDRVLDVARQYGIAVIEDAAEAIGSRFRSRPAGSFGIASAFSFHGSKTMTTGEGGMVVMNDPDLHQRCAVLRDHGRIPGDTMFQNREIGFKYKMSAMQAALGLAQIERIEELVAKKREIFAWYAELLGTLDGVTLNSEAPGVRNSYWMVTAVLDPKYGVRKEQFIAALASRGVDSRPMFSPLSAIPAYAGTPEGRAARDRNTTAHALGPFGVNLPSGLNLTRGLVEQVAQVFADTLTRLAA